MIDRLLQLSLRSRLGVTAVMIAVAILGYFAFSHLTIEAFPDPTDTQVQISRSTPASRPKRSSAGSRSRSSARSTACPA